jgi:5-methylcytosine-specific restriction endonuclease McrA
MRREFGKQVRRDAFARANGRCEGWTAQGIQCEAKLTVGKFHYDHIIPDAHGGEPNLANCAVICTSCHKYKTTQHDVPAIAKTKRIADRHIGIKSTRKKLVSRGFAKAEPQRSASRPLEKKLGVDHG